MQLKVRPSSVGRAGSAIIGGLLLTLVAGCASSESSGARVQASVAQIKSDIGVANLSDQRSMHAIDLDRGAGNAVEAARQVLAGSPSDAATWAAVYLYLDSGTDPAPLHALLGNKRLDVRAMAAAGAVTMGDVAGFPVLVDLLGNDGYMRASLPPLPLWRFAGLTLVRATADASRGPATDATPTQVAAAQKRWQAWWSANQNKLHWDTTQQLWVAG